MRIASAESSMCSTTRFGMPLVPDQLAGFVNQAMTSISGRPAATTA